LGNVENIFWGDLKIQFNGSWPERKIKNETNKWWS
jgi:hypothetical protein